MKTKDTAADAVSARRKERLAAIASQRQEDAALDKPLLEELAEDVPGIFADLRDRISSLISKSSANGVTIMPQIGNLNLVERAIMTALGELKGEAEAILNPEAKG